MKEVEINTITYRIGTEIEHTNKHSRTNDAANCYVSISSIHHHNK